MESSSSKKPIVSIIMPVYNTEQFISAAIESVLEQTFKDWELIVVDDCSTDDSTAIALAFADKDERVKVYINKTNQGVATSRNRGVAASRGEWIAFLDCDDVWRKEKLEKQLALAEKSGADLIYSSYSLFKSSAETNKVRNYIVPSAVTYKSMLKEIYICCSTVLVRRDALAGHCFSPDIQHEDYALWLELLKSGVRSAGCKEVLVDWRITPDSRSANKINAARNRWYIFRKVEKLPLHTALGSLGVYVFRGILKRYTGFKHIGKRSIYSE